LKRVFEGNILSQTVIHKKYTYNWP
jgi:hypothetical protein